MKRLLGVLTLLAAPLAAQAPADWSWRLDGATQKAPGTGEVAAGEWAYQQMPPGWHVTTTDQGVTLFPSTPRPMTGRWGVGMEFFLFPQPSDEGVGIALRATSGEAANHEVHFVLRRDGQVAMVAQRDTESRMVVPWTADTAAPVHDGEEVKLYTLRLDHEPGVLMFVVNGRARIVFETDGMEYAPAAGIRAGKGLNLHIARFDLIEPLAPARSR